MCFLVLQVLFRWIAFKLHAFWTKQLSRKSIIFIFWPIRHNCWRKSCTIIFGYILSDFCHFTKRTFLYVFHYTFKVAVKNIFICLRKSAKVLTFFIVGAQFYRSSYPIWNSCCFTQKSHVILKLVFIMIIQKVTNFFIYHS